MMEKSLNSRELKADIQDIHVIETNKKWTQPKNPYSLHIAIAPTKNIDRFECFLEKATEIGIDEVTPIICEHSERKMIKIERMEKIILSAAKQSLKSKLPKINNLTRIKDFIKPVNLGLHFINKLNPVSYMKMSKSQYRGEEDNDYRYEFGLLAQEVDEILKNSNPESTIVTKDQEGFLGMDYKQIIMPLIKSVQELSAEIDRLKAEIEELKK